MDCLLYISYACVQKSYSPTHSGSDHSVGDGVSSRNMQDKWMVGEVGATAAAGGEGAIAAMQPPSLSRWSVLGKY